MWSDAYDFPSVEDPEDIFEPPDQDQEWREWWEEHTEVKPSA